MAKIDDRLTVTMLLRLNLRTASEKSLVFRVVNALQYITFPLLRWLSGPYATYLVLTDLEAFIAAIPWSILPVYAVAMLYENLYTVLFGIQAVIFIIKPDFIKAPSNLD
jgi:hypothetical protein